MPSPALSRLRHALAGRYPLIHLVSPDERRLTTLLRGLSAEHFGDARPLVSWSSTLGFSTNGTSCSAITEPLEALREVLRAPGDTFYLFKDLPLLLDADPRLTRALRDLHDGLAGRNSWVFVSSASPRLPEALANHVFTVDAGLPGAADIAALLARAAPSLQPERVQVLAQALTGLCSDAILHLVTRLEAEHRLDSPEAVHAAHAEKAAALMREGCLKFMPETITIERVGGLENLKEWVLARRALFAGDLAAGTVPMPSGVLFMGVSGCGKSMAAKVIASAWSLPLLRLDMNLVLSGAWGTPEFAFDHALRVAEQLAPVVLWIDEMENSFGYDIGSQGGNSNIFSSFLTWMQEKPPGVFVVATANRIERLPAEVIRKGRFDQLFFLDLPNDDERRTILEIHLRAVGADPTAFNLAMLTTVTRNWSGAEIEQAVKAAVVRAWQEERPVGERDVLWSATHMVPLARTMEEQIKQLRIWSQDRATPASRKPPA